MSLLRRFAVLFVALATAGTAIAPALVAHLAPDDASTDLASACTPPVWFPPIVLGPACTPNPTGPPSVPGIPNVPGLPSLPVPGVPLPPVPSGSALAFLAQGTVLAYDLSFCPEGWAALEPARGRYLVGLVLGGTPGATVGVPLADGENRATSLHTHAVVDPGHSHEYIPPVPTSTGSGGSKAGYQWDRTSTERTGVTVASFGVPGTNAPYVQLTYCQATAPIAAAAPGAVAFFQAPFCPPGWLPFADGAGRYIVGRHASGDLGEKVGQALADRENRATGGHTHTLTDPGHSHAYFSPVYTSTGSGGSQAGIELDARTSRDATGITIAPAGTVEGTNAPYVQLLACKATLLLPFVPAGTVVHANAAACPAGWAPYAAGEGRSLVGLSAGGTLGAVVGTALGPGEDRALGKHTHAVSDPGHDHAYRKPVLSSTSSGSSKAGVGSPTRTSTDATGITLGLAGSLGGTNAPYLALRVCSS